MVEGAGKAKVPACVMQNGQCSRWCSGESVDGSSAENCASATVLTTALATALAIVPAIFPAASLEIHRVPLTEQISIICDGPAILDKAWETEGASALSRIAKHAIQICSRFLPSIFPMAQIIARDGVYFASICGHRR